MSHHIGAIVNFELNKKNAAKQCSFRFRFEFISNKSFVNKRMKIATKSEPQRAKIYKTSISCLPFLFRCGITMRCTMFGRRRYLKLMAQFLFLPFVAKSIGNSSSSFEDEFKPRQKIKSHRENILKKIRRWDGVTYYSLHSSNL